MIDKKLIEEVRSRNRLIDVAVELGGLDRTRVRGDEYLGPCVTGHTSVGNKCFHVSNDLCHCFNCGFGGDVFHLVQKVKFGEITSTTFMPALKWLAVRAGVDLPGQDSKGLEAFLVDMKEKDIAFKVLTAAAEIFHENLEPEHREFMKTRYGLNDVTLKEFKIGNARRGALIAGLRARGFSDQDCLLSGMFRLGPAGPEEFFNERIMFPYWKHGKVVYFIGRKTERTPKNEFEISKYKKLLTWSEKRSYIAKGVKNDTLYNQEAALRSNEIIVTEGVTDCLVLHQHGFPVISPVTIRFAKHDHEMVLSLLRKNQTVYIANDNDTNNAGMNASFDMAKFLSKHGHTVKLIELPLLEEQRDARRKLAVLEG